MATRNKGTRSTKKANTQMIEPKPQQQTSGAAQSAQNPAPTPQQAARAQEAEPTIRKGIYLSALVYIEGNQPAPEDFAAIASSVLKSALSSDHGDFSITLKKVEVQNNIEDSAGDGPGDAGGDNSAASKPDKFQF